LRFEPLEERRLLSLTGDYNADFVVDASDYVVWRKSVGATGAHPADGNGDLVVNHLDHGVWTEHFGEKVLPGPFSITTPMVLEEEFTITWETAPNATSYQLVLSNFPNLESPFLQETVTTNSRFFDNFGIADFYVGVFAMNGAGSTPATNQGTYVFATSFVGQTIFVTATNLIIETSNQYPPQSGMFGSAAAADYQVTQLASAVGLIDSWNGTDIVFQALLTKTLTDLPARAGLGNADFVNVNGDIVAESRAELYSGAHLAPILTQLGTQVPTGTVNVWTGSTANGEWSGLTAQDWSSRSSTATVGNVNGTGSTWLSNTTRSSNLSARLYAVGVRDTPFPNVPAPIVTSPIPDQVVPIGTPFSIDVANNFDNEREYYFRQASGPPLPSWLMNDFRTSVLTGTPTAADVGTITVEVTALEPRNHLTVIDQFELTVTAAGSSVSVAQAMPNASSSPLMPSFRQAEPDVRSDPIHSLATAHKRAEIGKSPNLALSQWHSALHDAALTSWLSSQIRIRSEFAGDSCDVDDEHARPFDSDMMDETFELFDPTIKVTM
jgi:hypothetical protein